jgi:hypothetical protein
MSAAFHHQAPQLPSAFVAQQSGVAQTNTMYACLYTKHKTQKRKIWQDGRLVLQSNSVILHDANPPPGSGDPPLGECEITTSELSVMMQDATQSLEIEKYLVQIEGLWTGRKYVTTVAKSEPPSFMKNVLTKKFQRPARKVPPPLSSRQQSWEKKRLRPLQPGELHRQYYGEMPVPQAAVVFGRQSQSSDRGLLPMLPQQPPIHETQQYPFQHSAVGGKQAQGPSVPPMVSGSQQPPMHPAFGGASGLGAPQQLPMHPAFGGATGLGAPQQLPVHPAFGDATGLGGAQQLLMHPAFGGASGLGSPQQLPLHPAFGGANQQLQSYATSNAPGSTLASRGLPPPPLAIQQQQNKNILPCDLQEQLHIKPTSVFVGNNGFDPSCYYGEDGDDDEEEASLLYSPDDEEDECSFAQSQQPQSFELTAAVAGKLGGEDMEALSDDEEFLNLFDTGTTSSMLNTNSNNEFSLPSQDDESSSDNDE